MSATALPRDVDRLAVAAPIVVACGVGVGSTASLVERETRGTPHDLVLT